MTPVNPYIAGAPLRQARGFFGREETLEWVQRELRNQLFQSGQESAGFAGLKWMYDGLDLKNLFS